MKRLLTLFCSFIVLSSAVSAKELEMPDQQPQTENQKSEIAQVAQVEQEGAKQENVQKALPEVVQVKQEPEGEKELDHTRNIVKTVEIGDIVLAFDCDQLSRLCSILGLFGVAPLERTYGRNPRTGQPLHWSYPLVIKQLADIVMMQTEISRGETARGLEHMPIALLTDLGGSTVNGLGAIVSLVATFRLFAKNRKPDRLHAMRLIKLLPFTLVGAPAAAIGALFHDPVRLIQDICKGQLPFAIYTKESFQETYGDEYKLVDEDEDI